MLRGEIDLSPAAKSHRVSLSDGEHYSQSLWIISTAGPHDLSALPLTSYLIYKHSVTGVPQKHSILTPPTSSRCLPHRGKCTLLVKEIFI